MAATWPKALPSSLASPKPDTRFRPTTRSKGLDASLSASTIRYKGRNSRYQRAGVHLVLPNLRVHLLGPLALPVLVYLRYQVRPVPKVPQDQDTVLDQAHTDR